MRSGNLKILFIIAAVIFLMACDQDYYPKPRGFFRIDMPEKSYVVLDSIFPYSFEYPEFTQIAPDNFSPDQPYWINIDYSRFKGSIHLSYKPVEGNLFQYLEDSRTLVLKHIPKASSIEEKVINYPERNIYGMTYHIKGSGAASPFQFFVTDSTNHFLRGALYFNIPPNNDSLAPVIEYIIEDIDHLLETFEWKDL
jgi:gliding motility-associated lipoprotein GldD